MKNYLNITQLAKLRNTTTETLRHYDRIGLLKPDYVDPDNGYRYYSLSQIEVFDTIMDLRNLDMPLKEIEAFMKERNIVNSYELLLRKQEELEKEINEKQELLFQIQQKQEFLKISVDIDVDDVSNWVIKKYKERIVILSEEATNDLSQFIFEYTKLRSNVRPNINIFGTNYLGSLISKESFFNENINRLERFPVIPARICEENIVYGKEYILKEGEYLCCFGRGRLQSSNALLPKIKKYLREKGYEITDYILERDVIDMSLTGNLDELIFKLEIPVKKNKI